MRSREPLDDGVRPAIDGRGGHGDGVVVAAAVGQPGARAGGDAELGGDARRGARLPVM